MTSGTTANLHDVWRIDDENVMAVGDNGTILHYDGTSWTIMNSGTTNDLFAVWGCGMKNVFAAGDAGTMLLFDGSNWSEMESGTSEPITALWSSDGSISCSTGWVTAFALVGSVPGSVLMYDYWTEPNAVWRSYPSESSEEFLDIKGFHEFYSGQFRLVAVGRDGTVYFYEWHDWYETSTGITDDLFAVFGESPDHLFAVADNGNVYQNTKKWMEDPPSRSWRQVASLGGGRLLDIAARSYNDIFIVGENGRIIHYDRREFTEMTSNTTSTIHAIWAGDTEIIAVGDDGLILTYSDPPPVPNCPLNVILSVTDEVRPYIEWVPNCPVSRLIVEGEDAGAWFIAADGNLIESGVQYGTVPEGALEYCPTGALRAGALYRVSLIRRDWDNEILIGAWNIIPSDSQGNGSIVVSKAKPQGPEDWLAQADADAAVVTQKFYLPRIRKTIPGQEIYAFGGVLVLRSDSWRWIVDPAQREDQLNVRPVLVETLVIDPETGLNKVITSYFYRAGEMYPFNDYTVIWDILRQ
jgi:hypothetical protein